jgi:hypothetical protein
MGTIGLERHTFAVPFHTANVSADKTCENVAISATVINLD